eukprot:CAMPEP_0184127868 /NCGR_PEP_ID=MMETSP0974-20121125/26291_1 /TAXON_ID=483370 /ORGANISM="non described non described, Strain CCMP2097" /LENGTH=131 /DNA_ID=CAMNT_0026431283 /DNA_START=95 /DNA_END=487 /DNA_ORIENTATION=-
MVTATIAALCLASASAARLGSRRLQATGKCCFFSFEPSQENWCDACVTPSEPNSWCSQSEDQCFDDCGANVGTAVWCPDGTNQAEGDGFEPSDCCLYSQNGQTCDVYANSQNWCAESATQCATCSGGNAFW